MDFDDFFEQEIRERKSKSFKTKKRLRELIDGQIQQDAEEESEGTSIQNSNDNVEDILKRNSIESRDIQIEKIRFFFDFRMPSLMNCKKLLASIQNNFDRKSGTLKVIAINNDEGGTEYVLLDGTHRYICYKYLLHLSVPADILKDSMEEWEWFYIAGGSNVISSTHAPMDIYSKLRLIGEIMEKKIDGKTITANDAKPIVQKNVPGFQEKCSKESINSYNRIYKSYKGKYLTIIQHIVMKKDTKSHSMVKDNLEIPSLMSLEDSKFKDELFRKMGESKMNKNEIISHINRHKLIKFVEDRIEDEDYTLKENIINAIERGKYDIWLTREDSSIRDGQIEGTKLWTKLQKLLNQEKHTNSKGEEDEQSNEDEAEPTNKKRKRKSDTAWESRLAKKRKIEINNGAQSIGCSLDGTDNVDMYVTNNNRTTMEGPVRFKSPLCFKIAIDSDEEYQFVAIDGELYLSLTCIQHEKYKQLKDIFRSKNLNTSVSTQYTSRRESSVKDPTNSTFQLEEGGGGGGEVEVDDDDASIPLVNDDSFNAAVIFDSDASDGELTNNNNNNNSRKSFSSVQSIGSYIFAPGGKNNNNSDHQSYMQNKETEEKDDIGPEARSSDNEAREESEHAEKKDDGEDQKEEKKRKSRKDKDRKHKRDKKHKKDKGLKSRKKDKGSKSRKKDKEEKKSKKQTDKNKRDENEKSLSKEADNTEDKQEEHSSSKFNSKDKAESDQIEGGDSYDDHDFDNDQLDYDSHHQQKCEIDANSEEGENKSDQVGSNDDDNDDDDGGQHVDENSEDTGNNNNNNNADYSTLEKNVKRYYNKISRIFHGKDSTPRLRQWKSGVRDFARHSGSYSIPELKVIFGLLNEWSKHLNQVKPKFEQQVELKQFVIDVLWYELSYRLLSDKHGESFKEAKNRLENSSKLDITFAE